MFWHYNKCRQSVLSLRVTQYFVTVKIYTLLSRANHIQYHIQYNTIQIVRAHTRDLTMAAAGQASGLARSATGIIGHLAAFNCNF